MRICCWSKTKRVPPLTVVHSEPTSELLRRKGQRLGISEFTGQTSYLHLKRIMANQPLPMQGSGCVVSNRPRVCLIYNDEGVRDRYCANAQRLLQTVLEDPDAISTSAQIAHKALRYRKVLSRLDQIDTRDPTFDVSAFFGVEWRKTPMADEGS
ncbi:unnamed protein product [Phytophthora fragariaefolia]|uniref:Unnamed protein product n=1 Tax=Phytophthora fragariaefolia TaxID=1490495 RepID=A0A9W6Y302_9STRA|nr:unnamed protein product [Phytophthora fragariaefolia]